MKKINFRLFILLTLSFFLSCKANHNTERIYLEVPKESKICIITASYEPVLLNNQWVCGQEYNTEIKRDTVYYDEFKNVLLRKRKFQIERTIYSLPKEEKVQTSYLINRLEKSIEIEKKSFMRNNKGELIGIDEELQNGSNKSTRLIFSARYDNEGNRIEEEDFKENVKTSYVINSSDDKKIIISYRTIKTTPKDLSNSEQDFIFNGILEKDSKTKLTLKSNEEKYSNGKLFRKTESIYFKNGKILKFIDLSIEGGRVIKWEYNYNESGEIKSKIIYSNSFSENLKIDPNSSEKYTYTYNNHGDWTKRIAYPINPEFNGKHNLKNRIKFGVYCNPNIPREITVRKIDYLNN